MKLSGIATKLFGRTPRGGPQHGAIYKPAAGQPAPRFRPPEARDRDFDDDDLDDDLDLDPKLPAARPRASIASRR